MVGTVASSFHGEPRMTRDIDVVARLSRANVPRLAAEFPEEDYYFDRDMVIESLKTRQPFNIIDLHTMWKADIILPRDVYASEQLARRQRVEVAGVQADRRVGCGPRAPPASLGLDAGGSRERVGAHLHAI